MKAISDEDAIDIKRSTRKRLTFRVDVVAPEGVTLDTPVVPYLIDRRLRDILCDLGYEPHSVFWDEETL